MNYPVGWSTNNPNPLICHVLAGEHHAFFENQQSLCLKILGKNLGMRQNHHI